jgi:hypothetical protein
MECKVEPREQHHWLHKLIGDWTCESECSMGPDKPREKFKGSETVRSLGGIWVVAEGTGEMPGGDVAATMMTLGYDLKKERFVGTWIGSPMAFMWVYDGELDAAKKKLSLHADGPDFVNEGKMAKYKDVIEFISDDHRTLTAHVLAEDGKWHEFMTAHYQRR